MRFPWHVGRRVPPELARIRRIRVETEEKLRSEREHVVIPLRELRAKNHVADAITVLIQQRGQGPDDLSVTD